MEGRFKLPPDDDVLVLSDSSSILNTKRNTDTWINVHKERLQRCETTKI